MIITLLLSIMMMAGLFLLLLGGVGFIQDKKFFSSAPKQVVDAVPEHKPERFRGQHVVGWVLIIIAFALMGGAMVLGAWDGIKNEFTFWQFAGRFILCCVCSKVLMLYFLTGFCCVMQALISSHTSIPRQKQS